MRTKDTYLALLLSSVAIIEGTRRYNLTLSYSWNKKGMT